MVQLHRNLGVTQNLLKHRRIPALRKSLKSIGHKTIIPVRTHWDSAAYRRIKLAGVPLPLFAGVVFEEHLIELFSDL